VITTPLFYVNAAPHMGSAYPTMACDALARYYRMQGRKVRFITGTDEHGEKIAQAAAAAGRSPQEHCDIVAAEFKALWKKLDISYDRFIRTTSPGHEKMVHAFMKRVMAQGDIYRASYEGLYCTGCEEYKDPKELSHENVCPLHLKPCQARAEENYFFRLSRYQTDVEALLESEHFMQPLERRNEVLTWVRDGLCDFSISRAKNPWGIPMPNDTTQTIYVWFDALLGYLTALFGEDEEPVLDQVLERGWPAHVHVLGKDITRFHACYWPAMLRSAGLESPQRLFSHGFLTKDGMKMGKSLGNTLDPHALVDEYSADAVRYYFLRGIEFGRDGDFSRDRFIQLVNAELANNVGNLLNRSMNLLRRHHDLTLPTVAPDQHPLAALARTCIEEAANRYAELNFAAAGEALMRIASEANVFIDHEAPWTKLRQPETRSEAFTTLAVILETVRVLGVALWPLIPQTSQRILHTLGYPVDRRGGHELGSDVFVPSWDDTQWNGRPDIIHEGTRFAAPEPVFPRLE
jgi:methionyl-tRNA synthetase